MTGAAEQLAVLRRLWDQQRRGPGAERPPYHFGERSLVHYLRAWAARRPDRVAVIHESTSLTFRELDDTSDRVAGWLVERLPGPGARVAIVLPNSAEFMIAFYAILKARAIVVPVNPGFRSQELQHQLGDSQPDVAIVAVTSMPSLNDVPAAGDVQRSSSSANTGPRPDPRSSSLDGQTRRRTSRLMTPPTSPLTRWRCSTTAAGRPGCRRAAPTPIAT